MRLSRKLAVVSVAVMALTGTLGAASAQTNRYTQQQAGPPYDIFFDGGPVIGGPFFGPAYYRPGPRDRWSRHRLPPPGPYGYGEPAYDDQDIY